MGPLSASGTESSTEEVSASHGDRDGAALMDIGYARCPEFLILMGKAFETEEGEFDDCHLRSYVSFEDSICFDNRSVFRFRDG